jgi:hypothetical protein
MLPGSADWLPVTDRWCGGDVVIPLSLACMRAAIGLCASRLPYVLTIVAELISTFWLSTASKFLAEDKMSRPTSSLLSSGKSGSQQAQLQPQLSFTLTYIDGNRAIYGVRRSSRRSYSLDVSEQGSASFYNSHVSRRDITDGLIVDT